jgi:hypothetical protein
VCVVGAFEKCLMILLQVLVAFIASLAASQAFILIALSIALSA